MCSRRYLLPLALLLLLSSPSWSDDACPETEDLLTECATTLDQTLTELANEQSLRHEAQSLVSKQASLIDDLMTKMSERDERLRKAGISLTAYERDVRAISLQRDVAVAAVVVLALALAASIIF